jgi:hypothetical protein
MKKPEVNILTWCEYADIHNEQMNILRTYSFVTCPQLPSPFAGRVALKLQFDDLQPLQTLQIRVCDYEGSKIHENEVALQPTRTHTDKWVFQAVLALSFEIQKIEYSLELRIKENGVILGTLPLPVAVAKKT